MPRSRPRLKTKNPNAEVTVRDLETGETVFVKHPSGSMSREVLRVALARARDRAPVAAAVGIVKQFFGAK